LGDIQQTNRWAASITWYSHRHPWDKPAQTPGETDPRPTKKPNQNKKKHLNNKQGTEKEHTAEGQGTVSTLEKGERSKELISMGTFNKQRPKRQKGWQQTGDKPLPETEQVAVHKAHLLSQRAMSKVKRCCKIEKQSANHHNTLTAGSRLKDLWPCPRENRQGKETSPQ
jgi:hypothetical protein